MLGSADMTKVDHSWTFSWSFPTPKQKVTDGDVRIDRYRSTGRLWSLTLERQVSKDGSRVGKMRVLVAFKGKWWEKLSVRGQRENKSMWRVFTGAHTTMAAFACHGVHCPNRTPMEVVVLGRYAWRGLRCGYFWEVRSVGLSWFERDKRYDDGQEGGVRYDMGQIVVTVTWVTRSQFFRCLRAGPGHSSSSRNWTWTHRKEWKNAFSCMCACCRMRKCNQEKGRKKRWGRVYFLNDFVQFQTIH